MFLRPAEASDHPGLAGIFLRAREASFTWLDPESLELDDFAVQTEGEVIHLAEDDQGRLLGFISVWEPEAFVHHLFIAPEHQRKGIGRALLADLQMRLAGPFKLKCMMANQPALDFYRMLGWTELEIGTTEEGDYFLMEWRPTGAVEKRPATREDLDFLWELHVLTMQAHVELTWGWDRVWQRDNFLKRFDTTGLEILEACGLRIGVIAVREEPDHFFLREIEIHPDWQRRGIGTSLVEKAISGANERGLPTRLQVLKVNPARLLYERIGFQLRGETETHFLMEHPAG
jgi:ribosomal protein S18 acetylase RimI-like enzyme